ncbi:unnamed protein product [Oppiella nova]|uniref:Glucosylceramidase n=1 Tax=Oppiella nova TaxID=334625 RepID=A0A7R9QQX0_9ACAR|nr:unnamed protein product [Oppiella nova]CAG2172307.1 unnamed protein product [Oppiella nova]
MICDDQRNKVHLWADTILKDKDAAKYVSGTAFHFYANKPENVVNLDKTHEIDPNRYILNTEASHNVPTLGFWPFLEDFSKDIIIDLNHWTNGWVHWNMALNLTGGPDWCGKAGAPIIVNATGQEYYKNPSFYGLGHFSKFVSPDSVRLELREDKPVDKVLTIAFERPDGGVVVIILNPSEAWSWELGGFGNTLVAQFNPVRFIPGPVFAVIDGVTGYSEEEAENALSRYEIFGDFNRTLPETDYEMTKFCLNIVDLQMPKDVAVSVSWLSKLKPNPRYAVSIISTPPVIAKLTPALCIHPNRLAIAKDVLKEYHRQQSEIFSEGVIRKFVSDYTSYFRIIAELAEERASVKAADKCDLSQGSSFTGPRYKTLIVSTGMALDKFM